MHVKPTKWLRTYPRFFPSYKRKIILEIEEFSFTTSFKGNYMTDWQRMQNFFRCELVMSEIECIDRLVLLIRLNSFCWLLGTWYGSLLLTSQLSLRSFLYVLVSCLLRLCSTKSKIFLLSG